MQCAIGYHCSMKTPKNRKTSINTIWFVWMSVLVLSACSTLCEAIINGIDSSNLNASSLCNTGICSCGYDSLNCACKNDKQVIEVTSSKIINGIANITISNCHTVMFASDSIKSVSSLRLINIKNVQDLQLKKSSLEWDGNGKVKHRDGGEQPRLEIRITDSTCANIGSFSFKGQTKLIHFINFHIKNIEPFAFSSLEDCESIQLQNCVIDNVQIQSFKTSKVKMLTIKNTTFGGTITSRTFSDIEIESLFTIMENSRFGVLKPNAFIINKTPKVKILDSSFDFLEGEVFKITTRDDVIIKRNTFGEIKPRAFALIQLDKWAAENIQKEEAVFDNNTITTLHRNSLYFDKKSFDTKVINLNINMTCTCDHLMNWLGIFQGAHLDQVYCQYEASKVKIVPLSLADYQIKHCNPQAKTVKTLVIVISVLVIIAACSAAATMYYCRKRDSKKGKTWINNASPILNRKNADGVDAVNGKLAMIVPDGRTYKETELHVIVERAELLTTEL